MISYLLLLKKSNRWFSFFRPLFLAVFIFISMLPPSVVWAQLFSGSEQRLAALPAPGSMVEPKGERNPATIRGLTLYPEEPFRFDFMVDTADEHFSSEDLHSKSLQLIKYFLTALTVPGTEQWVNLSPQQKDRIIPEAFGKTALGLDLLAQDYVLKQLTASLMYPEKEPGKRFWERVYQKAYARYGKRDIPMNTFHKIWIVPDKAVIYNNGERVFIVESRLKVMLEEDYEALRAAQGIENNLMPPVDAPDTKISDLDTEMIREIILPEIEKEVNHGSWFVPLRQIYNSVILAAWYKENLRQTLLAEIIADKNKEGAIAQNVSDAADVIYGKYMQALKKGVFDYIKEDYDIARQEIIPRRYFSGGVTLLDVIPEEWNGPITALPDIRRQLIEKSQKEINAVNVEVVIDVTRDADIRSRNLQAITQQPIHANEEENATLILNQVREMVNRAKARGIDINTLAPMPSAHAGFVFTQQGFYVALESGDARFYTVDRQEAGIDRLQAEVARAVRELSAAYKVKIVSAGLVNLESALAKGLGSRMWMDLDINWFEVAPDDLGGFPAMNNEARAFSAARLSASKYTTEGPFENYKVQVDPETNLVQADPLLSLQEYQSIASEEEWAEYQYWIDKIKDKVTMVFLNSTAQGGGVALMRHSNLRILEESGVDAQWFVMRHVPQADEKSFFDVTKQSFHNTFQGRASERLLEEDKKILEAGWERQLPHFEEVVENAKETLVVVVDDYQPSGMVEGIVALAKKYNKKVEFIYRSHIHFEADMAEGTDARHNWNFLWEKIRDHVKLAVIHPTDPIEESVPPNVPDEVATVIMNPSTDIIDGLNKRLPADILLDALLRFNHFLPVQNNNVLSFLERETEIMAEWFGPREININGDFLTPLDLSRPYVIQVARFDPSKNIAGALEAFALFRAKLLAQGLSADQMPQLVLTGHGAIDDPDGMKYLIDTMDRVHKLYPELAKDIKIVRLPHNDQVLNALLRYSFAALQLSLAEGFEIKVSEALQKGIPTIAYNVGGLGRQIVNEETGFLINPSREAVTKMPRGLDNFLVPAEEELAEQMPALEEVAEHLSALYTDQDLYARMQAAAYRQVKRDKFGLTHATRWAALAAVADSIPDEKVQADDVFRVPVDVYLDHIKVALDGPAAVQSQLVATPKQPLREDHAMTTSRTLPKEDVGGIDLNPEYINFTVRKDPQGMPLPLQFQQDAFLSVTGVNPIILNIAPVNVSTYLQN